MSNLKERLIVNCLVAPSVGFVQVDFNSSAEWEGQTFCADKEIYVTDADGNDKYASFV